MQSYLHYHGVCLQHFAGCVSTMAILIIGKIVQETECRTKQPSYENNTINSGVYNEMYSKWKTFNGNKMISPNAKSAMKY